MDDQPFLPRLFGGRFFTSGTAGPPDGAMSPAPITPLNGRGWTGELPRLQSPSAALPAAPAAAANIADAIALPLGRLGNLEVRLAASAAEVRLAQKLRYQVFYEEMSAIASSGIRRARRDTDAFDAICDHLLVIDHGGVRGNPQPVPQSMHRRLQQKLRCPRPAIVGTYRLLRQDVAERHGGFYTQGEFDIAPVVAAHRQLKFLELGRSCVLEPYRDKRTVELLWHGIWSYVLRHRIDVMLGCASLAGTDPDELALPLSYLNQVAKAPAEWRVPALALRRVAMDRLPQETINARAAIKLLPPLIKGYLRLGGYVGDGAVIDREFGTTDVLIVLPVANINPRYVAHYGADASRYAG